MTWMNEWEVQNALEFYRMRSETHPNALEAATVLSNLVYWTNTHSDGWPYWSKPSNAAKRLQDWLNKNGNRYVYQDDADLTDAELRSMLRPVKAFLTRQGANWVEVL